MNGLDHIAIQVSDISKSVEWYKNNLKATVAYCDESWAMLEISGIKLALTLPEQHPPHWAIKITDPTCFPNNKKIGRHRDGSQFVYIKDPDGNYIEYVYYPKETE